MVPPTRHGSQTAWRSRSRVCWRKSMVWTCVRLCAPHATESRGERPMNLAWSAAPNSSSKDWCSATPAWCATSMCRSSAPAGGRFCGRDRLRPRTTTSSPFTAGSSQQSPRRSDFDFYPVNASTHSIRFCRRRSCAGARCKRTAGMSFGLKPSICLSQITRQASSFTPAFAALATTLGGHLSIAGPPPLEPGMAVAARAAYKADPQLAEANVAMGLLSARSCQWTRADDVLR